jgi:threonine dehydrogenase-like Zn-dependent dehydrogenase
LLLSRRVVGEINAVCHECDHCRAGRPTHCSNRSVLGIQNRHGAFAEYTTLPDENLHVVPDDVDTDAATFAEPLAAALQIQTQVRIGPEDRVLVVGDGKLGQLIARTLKRVGCALQVVGKHAAKLRMLQDCGIETVFADGVATGKFDVSIEATGNADGFSIARRGLRPRGTLVLKSTYRGGLTLDVSRLVVDEVTVVGSRCGPFEPALTFLSEHAAELRSLITARYPLMEGIAAFDYARQPAAMKVLFDTELAGV